MTAKDRKLAAVLAVLMTGGVAVNLAAFQGNQGKAIETGGIPSRTSWVEGPGLNLGPTTPQAAAAETSPAFPGPAAQSQADDAHLVEVTRGIQRELGSQGYEPGQPDGVAGTVTRAAIFAYEYDNGFVLTGRPSEPLLSQLVLGTSSLAQNVARPGKTMTPDGEDFVRTIKQQLQARGYQVGAAGGALTPEFARAVREFEADQKLKLTGRISAPMVSRLIRLQGQPKARSNAVASSKK